MMTHRQTNYIIDCLVILLALTISLVCNAADLANSLIFKPINTLSPLPTNEIRKLHQDEDGYLWISTYSGLVRYDGYDCLQYKIDPSTGEQVLDSYVNLVKEDINKNIWIGTHDGLYKLDKLKENVIKIDFPVLNHCRVEDILPSKDGNIWFATDKGLFVKKTGGDEFEYCTGQGWDLDPTDMKSLMQDKQGYLWIGTWSDGLIRYDAERRKAHKYWKIPELRSSHTIFLDKDDNVWIGTFGSGLIKLIDPYNMQRQDYVLYQHDETNDNSLIDNIIYCISQDPVSGNLWIGSRSGLTIMSANNDTPQFVNYVPGKNGNGLPYNELNSIIMTKDNIMWLGFLGGGVYFVDIKEKKIAGDRMQKVYEHFGTNSVSRILEDQSDGMYWIGLAGYGLTLYSPKTGDFKNFRNIEGLSHLDQLLYVHDILYNEHTGEFCFGTEQGLVFYNRQTRHVRLFSNSTGARMKDDYVRSIDFDRKGNMWICTRADIGCLTAEGKYSALNNMLAEGEMPMESGMVYGMDEDRHGNVWIATRSNGIYCASEAEDGWHLYHWSKSIGNIFTEGGLCLHIDSRDNIWVGTETGLLLYNKETESFDSFRSKEMSFYGGTYINGIWEDRKHNLWLATNNGILEMHLTDNKEPDYIRLYTSEDGLLDDYFHQNAFCSTSDGNLLIGSMRGINFILVNENLLENDGANVSITDFRIFNHSIRELPLGKKEKITKKAIEYTEKIVLPYDMNNFSIEYALLSFRDAAKSRYAYCLEGYDKEMIYTDSKHRFAYYNNLPAGTYKFVLEASNAGNLQNPAKREFIIKIKPAPWFTWWAFMIYLFIIGGVVYILFRMQSHRIRLEKAVELSEMDRKTSEELNQVKLQFFTNITHELLTPLSIIVAAVDELKTKNRDIKEYDLITNNALRLMRLIQQILEFRKAESGNLRLKVSEGDIVEFLRNCVDAFRPLANQRGISYSFNSRIGDSYRCLFDTDKLDKIMYNLLSNAEKYNRENGSVMVEVGLDEDQDNVIITVTDTGYGMTDEALSNLFKRFYDGNYRQYHTIGTGIGLSLVKNLVDIHHGRISVESKHNVGTTFTVSLPVQEEEYLESEKANVEQVETDDEKLRRKTNEVSLQGQDQGTEETITYNGSKVRLLLVEDNDDMRFLLQRHLLTNFSVISVNNAEAAIKILQQENAIDIVVSDIMMPGMNGYDLCAYVKNTLEFCHIPVILLTAKQTSADKIAGYEVGADAYLTKPVNLAELDALISNQIKKKERQVIDYSRQLVFNVKELSYTSMDEQFMQKAVDYVNEHLTDSEFSISDFVDEMNMSRTTLSDKLKSLTGMTPSRFINDIRLRTACRLLEEQKGNIRVSELAYLVGFNDPKYFSTLFKKKYNVSPQEYIRKKGE